MIYNLTYNIQMPKIINLIQKKEQYSFLYSVRKRFVDEFTRIKERYQLNNIVLVLDLFSAKYISSLFTITQLVTQGIVFIERLQKVRKNLDHHAIYFITPTEQSIQCMLNDFKSADQCRYRKVHVLLSSAINPTLMKKIGNNIIFLKKLARHSFKEFYFELSVLSDNCIHLSIDYLSLAFSRESNEQMEARVRICTRFVDLISSYDSLNVVRICYQPSVNLVAGRIAERAAKQIKRYLGKLLDNKSLAVREEAPDITIYVTDRSIDIITPLIHSYAYEALLYDIVNVSDNQNEGTDPNKLKGDTFQEFRYRHISHALASLPQRLQNLVKKISDREKLEAIQIKQLKDQKEDLEIHIELLRRLWEKFKEKGLSQLGELELCLTTGITDEGKQTSSSELFDKVVNVIKNSIKLSPDEIIRIALLTIICIKLTKTDYQALVNLFKEQQRIIFTNLAIFGIRYEKSISKSTKAIDTVTIERARIKLGTQVMSSQRFTCALEIVLPKLIEFFKSQRGKIDSKLMKQIVVSMITKEESAVRKFDQKRLICFMCGGLSQTEVCSIRKNASLSNILLAADQILTPNKFVQSLSKIDLLSKNAQ